MTGAPSPPPAAPSGPGTPAYLGEVPWRRLDPRMLLVHPVHELVRFLPFLLGVLVLGSTAERGWWQLVGVVLPVAVGVLRFLTTRFRITPTQVELRRGLLGRSTLTARLDRVRAVELTSTPVHRLLGLARVEIGTASSAKDHDETFTLDALPLAQARELRIQLLHRSEVAGTDAALEPSSAVASPPAPAPDQTLVRLDPRWARYAPLTASGSVVAAAIAGALGQFADNLGERLLDGGRSLGWLRDVPIGELLAGGAVAFLVLSAVFGVLGYWVSYAGFTLTRDARGRTYHVRRGLFTSRETSLEAERVRGVQVGEPLGLRLARAARLSALTTGLSRQESGATLLVPPAPREVVDTTGALVLGDPAALAVPLVHHGPAARRRRWTRAVGPVAVLLVAAVVVCLLTPVTWWLLVPVLAALPLAVALAEDRYRRLGHALAAGHLVVRSGSLNGRLTAVQRTGIIGWNLQQSWFQRRAGLVHLVATTAAGTQAYVARDIPEADAARLADETLPGLVRPFLCWTRAPGPSRGPRRCARGEK